MRQSTAVIVAILRRPGLWPTALRQMFRLSPRGWWRRPPYLPVPTAEYLRFRLVTAYGGDGSLPAARRRGSDQDEPDLADDVVSYLQWCRSWSGSERSWHRRNR